MQNSRYSYAHGGLSSLKEARDLLHSHAPKGEHLAYINPQEATLLKSHGGSGIMTASGIRSYGWFSDIKRTINKLIPKEIPETLNKIIPNEIKPFLPYLAAAVPFLGPMGFLGSGVMGMTGAELAALSAGANAASQMSQEGYKERGGLNPVSTGLAGLGGYMAGAGTPEAFQGLKTTPMQPGLNTPYVGMTDVGVTNNLGLNQLSQLNTPYVPETLTENLTNKALDIGSSIAKNSRPGEWSGFIEPPTPPTTSINNLGVNINPVDFNQMEPYTLDPYALDPYQLNNARTPYTPADLSSLPKATEPGQDLLSAKSALQLAPGEIAAATEQAYNAAQDALREYNKKQGNIKNMTQADLTERRYYIQRYMQMAGFSQSDIDSALSRQGLMRGGRARYETGGITPKFLPMDLESVGLRLFNKNIDNLTYTEKQAVRDYIDDSKNKKAKGGLMSLSGNEMDFRAAGGFVPIGKKERADDVPARLSKNEFVFTAKAVRNAGGGNIKHGAKRMYQLMKHLEARV